MSHMTFHVQSSMHSSEINTIFLWLIYMQILEPSPNSIYEIKHLKSRTQGKCISRLNLNLATTIQFCDVEAPISTSVASSVSEEHNSLNFCKDFLKDRI